MLVFVSDVTIHCTYVIVTQSCRELMHMQVMVAHNSLAAVVFRIQ